MKIYFLLLIMLLIRLDVLSQSYTASDNKIGMSDLIITGKVISIEKDGSNEYATINVEKVLKGEKIDKVKVNHIEMMKLMNKSINIDDQKLFMLEKDKSGYIIYGIAVGILSLEDTEKVMNDIKNNPIEITYTIDDKFYFNFFYNITIVIKNISNQKCKVSNTRLKGFYYSNKLDSSIESSLLVYKSLKGEIEIDAGAEQEIPMSIWCKQSPSWKDIDSNLFLLSPIALKIITNVSYTVDNDNKIINSQVSSMYSDHLIGFPITGYKK